MLLCVREILKCSGDTLAEVTQIWIWYKNKTQRRNLLNNLWFPDEFSAPRRQKIIQGETKLQPQSPSVEERLILQLFMWALNI